MERMDVFLSVFNGHINDADRRARRAMAASSPDWLAEIERIEREGKGIMAIFSDGPPTVATVRYASLVEGFVNEQSDIAQRITALASALVERLVHLMPRLRLRSPATLMEIESWADLRDSARVLVAKKGA